MDFSLGKIDFPAVLFHRRLLRPDIARHIVRRPSILLPLGVDIRLHEGNDFLDGHGFAQKDIIDNREARQKGHPLAVIKIRPPRSFIDILRGGYGNDKDIALFFCLFQMLNMPIMQKIKNAVAQNDLFSLVAKSLPTLEELFFADDFFIGHEIFPHCLNT